MPDSYEKQKQLEAALESMSIPPGVELRCWTETDFPDVERLSTLQGWPTLHDRPEEALVATLSIRMRDWI